MAAGRGEKRLTPRRVYALWADSLSDGTRRVYEAGVRSLMAYTGDRRPQDLVQRLKRKEPGPVRAILMGWNSELAGEGLAANTYNLRVSAVSSLLKHLNKLGVVSWRIDMDKLPARTWRDVTGPDQEIVDALFEDAEGRRDDPMGLRDLVILHLLYTFGLRRAGALSIRLDQMSLRGPAAWFRYNYKGERAETRRATIPLECRGVFREWLALLRSDSGPFLVAMAPDVAGYAPTERCMSADSLNKRVHALGARVGCPELHPHALRHAAATALYRETGDVQKVQLFLGHKSIATTERYIAEIEDAHGKGASLLARRRGKE